MAEARRVKRSDVLAARVAVRSAKKRNQDVQEWVLRLSQTPIERTVRAPGATTGSTTVYEDETRRH